MKTNTVKPSGRIVAHFSCGAASACATKLAIEKYETVEIFYCDPGREHPDSKRFLSECEDWFGQKVKVLRSKKYKNHFEVIAAKRFLSSQKGAPCTGELKKLPWMEEWKLGDTEILGYTANEIDRIKKWKRENTERIIECPLIDKHLTKQDCFGILERVGIELPEMYKLGFRNNNCIACVKARDSVDYWKRVRKYFPEDFAEMAKWERELNFAINRVTRDGIKQDVYLDEIEEGDPKGNDPDISCGLFCMAEADSWANEKDQS